MHFNAISTPYRELLVKAHGGVEPLVVRAPGRINLIGEHTDYNQGLALPAAINRYIYVSVSLRDDDLVNMLSDEFSPYQVALSDLYPCPGEWHTYIQGVAAVLLGQGHPVGGFNIHVYGDIPVGAGLSSSAALCCGTVMALSHLFSLFLEMEEMALIAQQAEHMFAGVACGLMDQYACLFGKRGYALKLDFRSIKFEYVRLNLEELDLVLLDTGVKHSLASTEYNLRKAETNRALELVKVLNSEVGVLRDCNMEMLYDRVLVADPLAFKRSKFFIEENKRVKTAAVALSLRKLTLVGELLYESHQGLASLYQVSCNELDLLVQMAKAEKSIVGARMMGGGFGGCTINLVEKKYKSCIERMSSNYEFSTGIPLKAYRLMTTDGARLLDQREIRQIRYEEKSLEGNYA